MRLVTLFFVLKRTALVALTHLVGNENRANPCLSFVVCVFFLLGGGLICCKVRLLVSDRWIRAASKRSLEGVNDGLLRLCSEKERRENEEILELSAASLAIASVQKYQEEVRRSTVVSGVARG